MENVVAMARSIMMRIIWCMKGLCLEGGAYVVGKNIVEFATIIITPIVIVWSTRAVIGVDIALGMANHTI